MSLGRVDTFLDSYIERDMKTKKLTEEQVIMHTQQYTAPVHETQLLAIRAEKQALLRTIFTN